MQASAPPATTTSTSPDLIIRQPQASASAPDAHADTGACTPGLGAQLQPDVGGRAVRHEHRDGQRRDLAQRPAVSRMSSWPSSVSAPPMPVPTITASRSGSTTGSSPAQPGVRPGLAGGDDRHLLAPVQPAGLDPLEHLGGLHRQLRGDPHRQVEPVDPLGVQPRHPRPPGEQGVPGRRGVPAERGRRAVPGDDNVSRTHWVSEITGSSRCSPRRRSRSSAARAGRPGS